jgi:hypothetical protein
LENWLFSLENWLFSLEIWLFSLENWLFSLENWLFPWKRPGHTYVQEMLFQIGYQGSPPLHAGTT